MEAIDLKHIKVAKTFKESDSSDDESAEETPKSCTRQSSDDADGILETRTSSPIGPFVTIKPCSVLLNVMALLVGNALSDGSGTLAELPTETSHCYRSTSLQADKVNFTKTSDDTVRNYLRTLPDRGVNHAERASHVACPVSPRETEETAQFNVMTSPEVKEAARLHELAQARVLAEAARLREIKQARDRQEAERLQELQRRERRPEAGHDNEVNLAAQGAGGDDDGRAVAVVAAQNRLAIDGCGRPLRVDNRGIRADYHTLRISRISTHDARIFALTKLLNHSELFQLILEHGSAEPLHSQKSIISLFIGRLVRQHRSRRALALSVYESYHKEGGLYYLDRVTYRYRVVGTRIHLTRDKTVDILRWGLINKISPRTFISTTATAVFTHEQLLTSALDPTQIKNVMPGYPQPGVINRELLLLLLSLYYDFVFGEHAITTLKERELVLLQGCAHISKFLWSYQNEKIKRLEEEMDGNNLDEDQRRLNG
ncbi:hypothetical protein QAD02_008417 [Eretmocerus hayati]|uniref:Uncharacterized protein n=1 Tax=Eretmocerus hayati TaxID=131215 RepID=A0ACC2N6D3_9HYME|nr:hypothetical protein QAD02_008417 [Eretmocerus hayati]